MLVQAWMAAEPRPILFACENSESLYETCKTWRQYHRF
jgi:hypothetical protein